MKNPLEHHDGTERTVICPMCGKAFTCALSSTCWCVTKKVSPEVRAYLAERYTTCVCSGCLDRLLEQSASGELS